MMETLMKIWLWGLLLCMGALGVRVWLQWSHKIPKRFLATHQSHLREPEPPPPPRCVYPWELDERR